MNLHFGSRVALGAALLVACSAPVTAQNKATSDVKRQLIASPGLKKFSTEQLTQFLQVFRQTVKPQSSFSCADNECTMTSAVSVIDHEGTQYCLIPFQDVTISNGRRKTKIVWQLDLSQLGDTLPKNYKIEFLSDQGMLFSGDPKGQMVGQHGSPGGSPKDHTKYHVNHANTDPQTAFYIPLVGVLNDKGDVASLCAASDPKIINT